MNLFEAHITFKARDRLRVDSFRPNAWKYSAIDGDPVLGKEVFCYLTSYDNDAKELLARMRLTVEAFRYIGITAVRQKIEQIVYDTKTDRNEIETT